jgi:hypothetical protein
MNAKHLCDQSWRNLLAIDFTAWHGVRGQLPRVGPGRREHARRYTEGR